MNYSPFFCCLYPVKILTQDATLVQYSTCMPSVTFDSIYFSDWPCNVTLPWGYRPQLVASPRYPFPPKLNQTCILHLIAPPFKTVFLRIRSLLINSSSCSDPRSGLFIYDGDTDQSEMLLSVCLHRQDIEMSSVTSSNRSLTVKISSLTVAVVTKMTYEYGKYIV